MEGESREGMRGVRTKEQKRRVDTKAGKRSEKKMRDKRN